jgi:glc operon protein GlcG
MDGREVVALRNDRALFASLQPARGKALAALMLRMPTQGAVGMAAGPDPVLARAISAVDDVLLVPGGFPIFRDGDMIGAVGVSGGHYRDDHAVGEKVTLAATEASKRQRP